MATRTAHRVVDAVWLAPVVGVGLFAGSLALAGTAIGETSAGDIGWHIAMLGFVTVGAIIVSKQRRNVIGWLFLVTGQTDLLAMFAGSYAEQAYQSGTGLPFADVAVWLAAVLWAPGAACLVATVTLFPTGTPPSRRWRWALVPPAVGVALTALVVAPWSWVERGPALLAAEELGGPLGATANVSFTLIVSGLLLGLAAFTARFRAATGVERLQMRWFLVGVLLALGNLFVDAVLLEVVALSDRFTIDVVTNLLLLALPASVGIAILRYRLYDLDRFVNRAIVYAGVSLLLAAIYVSVAVLPTALLDLGDSDLLVAGATLAAAAAFRPIRGRVQAFVDRRFYRSRYDAARTVEAFAARLRAQVALDALAGDLRDVVSTSLVPRHVSVWLHQHEVNA